MGEKGARGGRLQGKVALITGAASGIGRATAIRFAEEGAKVALSDIAAEKGHAFANELTAAGHDAFYQDLDVTSPGEWQRGVGTIIDRWGRIDVLVNSAGIGHAKGLLDMTYDFWQRTIRINLDGTFLGT